MASQNPNWRESVSRETIEKLTVYADLLIRWQNVQNLVAPSTLTNIWVRHFEDSAQISVLGENAKTWVDLGSGAGFPGMVIAMLRSEILGTHVHLIESNQRKCAFSQNEKNETENS